MDGNKAYIDQAIPKERGGYGYHREMTRRNSIGKVRDRIASLCLPVLAYHDLDLAIRTLKGVLVMGGG